MSRQGFGMCACVLILAGGIVSEKASARNARNSEGCNGTDILHWTIQVNMTANGADSDAKGWAVANHKTQGHGVVNHQSLSLWIANLEPDTTYDLAAIVDGETNLVARIQTETNGTAVVHYGKKTTGRGHGRRPYDPLPAALDPVSNITALQICNSTTQIVLQADFTAPDRLQYLVKRCWTEGHVRGALRIKAHGKAVQFRWGVSGLTPSAPYFFVINDHIAATRLSDGLGNLNLTTLPGDAPDVLDITHIALWDGSSNSVLSTTLP